MTWSTSAGDVTHTFGEMTRYCDNSFTTALNEEIMRFLIYNDANDIEGFAFKDYAQYS